LGAGRKPGIVPNELEPEAVLLASKPLVAVSERPSDTAKLPAAMTDQNADELFIACRRWLVDYKARTTNPKANFDDLPEYIECIKAVGLIGTPEAISVLKEVRSNAVFANISIACNAALETKFKDEGPVEKCNRYLVLLCYKT
jgi:hypothetical protein